MLDVITAWRSLQQRWNTPCIKYTTYYASLKSAHHHLVFATTDKCKGTESTKARFASKQIFFIFCNRSSLWLLTWQARMKGVSGSQKHESIEWFLLMMSYYQHFGAVNRLSERASGLQLFANVHFRNRPDLMKFRMRGISKQKPTVWFSVVKIKRSWDKKRNNEGAYRMK